MTSIALPRITPTTYPLEQLFTDVGEALLSACTESTAQAFRKVVVEKLDAQGNVAPIRKVDENNREYFVYEDSYIQDVHTQEIWDESQNTIRLKCLALSVLGIPIYIPCAMAWHYFQLYRGAAIIAINAIRSASMEEAWQHLRLVSALVNERVRAFVLAIPFGVGMELSCIVGLFKPYHGRKLETQFEKALHHGVPYNEDIRHCPANPRTLDYSCNSLLRRLENQCNSILYSGKEYYLAYCFLVRAKLPHPHYRVLRILEV